MSPRFREPRRDDLTQELLPLVSDAVFVERCDERRCSIEVPVCLPLTVAELEVLMRSQWRHLSFE